MKQKRIGKYIFVEDDYNYTSTIKLNDCREMELQLDINYTDVENEYVTNILTEIENSSIGDHENSVIWNSYRNYYGTTEFDDIAKGDWALLTSHYTPCWVEIKLYPLEFRDNLYFIVHCICDWDDEHGFDLLFCNRRGILADPNVHPYDAVSRKMA